MSTTRIQPAPLHQGNTIILRRVVPTDAAFLFEKAYQNLDFIHRFRVNDTPQNVEEVRNRLKRQWQSTPEQSGYLEMLIIHKKYGPIGLAVLAEYSPFHRRAEYLIGLFDKEHRQAWYGIETTLLVIDLAFNRYNLHKLIAYTYAYNEAGQKNLLGGGFVDEGLRREHLYSEAEGRFIDIRAFGMTLNDFRRSQLTSRLSRRLVGYDITHANEQPVTTIYSNKYFYSKGYKLLGSAISVVLSLSTPVYAANYDVTAASDDGTGGTTNSLSWAIWQANTNPGTDTITLKTDMTVTGVMKRLINSDVTLQSDDTVRTISGGNTHRPLFIKSGHVNIQNLNLNNGLAKGGYSNKGGGGAGLGGALFVYSGTVNIDSVTFNNNIVQGGSGGIGGSYRTGGGGGMYGSGNHGGGGLFASSSGDEGAYDGPVGNPYGGFGGSNGGGSGGFAGGGGHNDSGNGGNGGFGGGGGFGYYYGCGYITGGNGGFGGGGGYGYGESYCGEYGGYNSGSGGNGGFGGGGGYGNDSDGNSGFGGGRGGITCSGSGKERTCKRGGGGGAGFGGAIFAKKGIVTLSNVNFTNNSAIRGTGLRNGKGRGGAIFICTASEGESECSAIVKDCSNNTFTNNSADDGENDIFGILNSCIPNLVMLSNFQINDKTLSWNTTIELDNAGFNVWRRIPNGPWEKINDTLIPARGEGSTYTFIDSSAILGQNYEYRLEDIDMSGSNTFHYPEGIAPMIDLISPVDGAILSAVTVPVFQWNTTNYDGFRFQYAYPGSEIQTFPMNSWNSTMSFTPNADLWTNFVNQLEVGETVYWRIQGKLDNSEDNYSDVQQFTIIK
ncbi:hypothetical protein THII_0528 [Thioploca ingrica]|uniref:N-acetyltransferase domain-containing protein n=1 Tax=Thioploca ingrica TaxID=40754 RepID=A0A090AJ05_9GAMM|nr:hypothetical protein THII_0528 [Thioploca ingrica]